MGSAKVNDAVSSAESDLGWGLMSMIKLIQFGINDESNYILVIDISWETLEIEGIGR